MKRLSVMSAVALGALLLTVPAPAQAVVPGDFAGAQSIQGGVTPWSPGAASLPSGAVAVVYPFGNTVNVRIRKPGAATFDVALVRTLDAGYNFATSAALIGGPAINVEPLTASSFVLGWTECSGMCRVVSVNLPITATSIAAPTVVSHLDDVVALEPRLSAAPDGSAAMIWSVGSAGTTNVRVSHRSGSSGAWSLPITMGSTPIPYNLRVSIDSNRSVSAAWFSPNGAEYEVRVRSRVNGVWALTTVASVLDSSGFGATSDLFDLKAAGSTTVLAAITDLAGTSNHLNPVSMGVRVLSRDSTTAQFSVDVAGVTGPGRYAVQPTVSVNANGSAVVRFADFSRSITSTPNHAQVSTLVVQRQAAGQAWSRPVLIDAVGVEHAESRYSTMRFRAALLADGTYITPSLRTTRVGTGVEQALGVQMRDSWTAPMVDVVNLTQVTAPTPAIALTNVTGRTTLVYFTAALDLVTRTTSLTKPVAIARASLSTTSPRRGTAVTCRITWAEATSVQYQWRRNGVAMAGATARTYTPRAADVGEALSCRSVGRNSKGPVASVSIARTVRSS